MLAPVLKTPKTDGSSRKVFLPKTVAHMMIAWKKEQDFAKEALGNEYQDYNLVICGATGFPVESSTIQSEFNMIFRKWYSIAFVIPVSRIN